MLSLTTNPACLLMDDELNILPTSSHVRDIRPLPRDDEGKVVVSGPSAAAAAELADLVSSLADTQASTPGNQSTRALVSPPGKAVSWALRRQAAAELADLVSSLADTQASTRLDPEDDIILCCSFLSFKARGPGLQPGRHAGKR